MLTVLAIAVVVAITAPFTFFTSSSTDYKHFTQPKPVIMQHIAIVNFTVVITTIITTKIDLIPFFLINIWLNFNLKL